MAKKKGVNCRNRLVVHAENRLHSPFYDWEGEAGLAQSSFEFIDADAMCFWGICDSDSYNAWVSATQAYFDDVLVPHYKKTLGAAEAHFGSAPIRIDILDRLDKIKKLIREWDEEGLEPNKDWSDNLMHPFDPYWWGLIRGVITYFDEAACAVDELDTILAEDLKRPSAAKGVPKRTLEASPTGSYLDGSGGPSPSGGDNGVSKGIGIVALGAAAYFGYKVLTE